MCKTNSIVQTRHFKTRSDEFLIGSSSRHTSVNWLTKMMTLVTVLMAAAISIIPSAVAQPVNHATTATFSSLDGNLVRSTKANDENFETNLFWQSISIGDMLLISLSQPQYIGAVMFVLNNGEDNRRKINLYAGSNSQDPTMNTQCNDGVAFYADGTVNCYVDSASYLQIVIIDTNPFATFMLLEEVFIFTEIDIAQYATIDPTAYGCSQCIINDYRKILGTADWSDSDEL